MVCGRVEQVRSAQSPALEAGEQQGCVLGVREDHSQCPCCSSEVVLVAPSSLAVLEALLSENSHSHLGEEMLPAWWIEMPIGEVDLEEVVEVVSSLTVH